MKEGRWELHKIPVSDNVSLFECQMTVWNVERERVPPPTARLDSRVRFDFVEQASRGRPTH